MPFDAGLAGDGESLELRMLREARRTLSDPQRWIRSQMYDDWGSPAARGCAVGHLAFAEATFLGHGPAVARDNARAVAARCLAPLISDDMVMWNGVCDNEYEVVTSYNDHHATSHADILALFDQAIAREAAEQEVTSDAV